jgi:integrase
MRQYYRLHKPKEYLFEGQFGGKYSGSSILKVIKTAAWKAGIQKRVYPHILRHSFATAAADRTFA